MTENDVLYREYFQNGRIDVLRSTLRFYIDQPTAEDVALSNELRCKLTKRALIKMPFAPRQEGTILTHDGTDFVAFHAARISDSQHYNYSYKLQYDTSAKKNIAVVVADAQPTIAAMLPHWIAKWNAKSPEQLTSRIMARILGNDSGESIPVTQHGKTHDSNIRAAGIMCNKANIVFSPGDLPNLALGNLGKPISPPRDANPQSTPESRVP